MALNKLARILKTLSIQSELLQPMKLISQELSNPANSKTSGSKQKVTNFNHEIDFAIYISDLQIFSKGVLDSKRNLYTTSVYNTNKGCLFKQLFPFISLLVSKIDK